MENIRSYNYSRVRSEHYQISPIELTTTPLFSTADDIEQGRVNATQCLPPNTNTVESDTAIAEGDAPEGEGTQQLDADLDNDDAPEGEGTRQSDTDQDNDDAPRHTETPTKHLLATEKPAPALRGWPDAPRAIRSPWWVTAWDILFDLTLFACAVALLVFAVVVELHDGAPTSENPRTTQMLLNATKYVST
jgi:hypothetical protein